MKKIILTTLAVLVLAMHPGTAPAESASTFAFRVYSARAVRIENENIRPVAFLSAGEKIPAAAYVIGDDTAHLRLECTAADDISRLAFCDITRDERAEILSLLDAGRGLFVCDLPMPEAGDTVHFVHAGLCDGEPGGTDPDAAELYLITGEEYIEEAAGDLRAAGYEDFTWEFRDPADAEAEQPPQAYILHVTDRDRAPVPGVYASFCTDTACFMCESDAGGIISFDGAPDIDHIQLLKVPEGYSFDADFCLYTEGTFGEWAVYIRKDE